MNSPTALIAEDEPVLARTLRRQLAEAWPQLQVLPLAENGPTAIEQALLHTPDLLFLDIQMPGCTGLQAAEAVADDWPEQRPRPLFVFVTAFDQYAVAAFERAAADYVLKPVTPERLAQTVQRLQQRLAERDAAAAGPGDHADLVRQMQALATPANADDAAAAEPIRVIRAATGPGGNTVRMIPLADVILFEASDKYVTVLTEAGDALVRMSLRELAARVQGVPFVQVHRSLLVASERITSAERDEAGHYWLTLRGLARPVKVSRAFSHLFRPM
jgi:DNA-binding LytR/AlgR family response regulator